MPKIYCKNCKYWYDPLRDCQKILERKIVFNSALGKYEKKEKSIWIWWEKYNKDNNCPYYQRKWWKFWIK